MMDCTQYRRSLMAAPRDPDAALAEHRATCDACRLYTERLLRFESRLERALKVTLPEGAVHGDVVPLRRPAQRRSWLAMAASVVMALVVAGGLWLSAPHQSLAAAVVTHMAGEPEAWRRTEVPVSDPELLDVLRSARLRLTGATGVVSYAASCDFRGHRVPHLVVQSASGPVTVMVLVHEDASKQIQFDEQGYRGVIVPVAGHGSLAVLMRGSEADAATVDHIAHQVLESIVWTG